MDTNKNELETFRKEDLGEREGDWDGERGYKPMGGVRAGSLYDIPLEDADRGQEGRRRRFGRDELMHGQWLYIVDNDLPGLLAKTLDLWEDAQQQPAVANLCQNCQSFQVLSQVPQVRIQELSIDIDKLKAMASSCDLCGLFFRCITRCDSEVTGTVEFFRDCSTLKLHEQSRPFLTILGDVGSEKPSAKTQIGLPQLPDAGSQAHFDKMRGWLKVCDDKHAPYGCHLDTKSVLPTRILDLGKGAYSDYIHLYTSKRDEQADYVALSHCWGQFTNEQRAKFSTFKENIHDRTLGIEIQELPKSFRDAIRVTRELGKRYLWIDSLCIIQNDSQDWKKEASTMEKVYSMAYVTIAATSAQDSSRGFLKPRRDREFVKIEKPPPPPEEVEEDDGRFMFRRPERYRPRYTISTTTGNGIWTDINANRAPPEVEQFPLYICEHIDNFTHDVEESALNSRGWVFQERGLSRRILHFSDTQTYFECGFGVHCETLTVMYNSNANILGDPQFPSSMANRTDNANISFFVHLFKIYMQRAFTQPMDRSIAFSGLERRLSAALETTCHYGVIEKFFHRTLLWSRAPGASLLKTLPGSGTSQEEMAPSWSWMGYEGRIDFLPVGYEAVAWSDAINFRNDSEIRCCVRSFRDCRIMQRGDNFVVLGEGIDDLDQDVESNSPVLEIFKNTEDEYYNVGVRGRNWLRFDTEAWAMENLRCIIVGNELSWGSDESDRNSYILVVKQSGNSNKEFERLGVGCVRWKYIDSKGSGLEASLI